MDKNVKHCDVCEALQLSANGWIRYQDTRNFVVLAKNYKTTASHKDACGHACVINAFAVWLSTVHVNVPVAPVAEGKGE